MIDVADYEDRITEPETQIENSTSIKGDDLVQRVDDLELNLEDATYRIDELESDASDLDYRMTDLEIKLTW